jgi:hypothetical protein
MTSARVSPQISLHSFTQRGRHASPIIQVRLLIKAHRLHKTINIATSNTHVSQASDLKYRAFNMKSSYTSSELENVSAGSDVNTRALSPSPQPTGCFSL